MQFNLVGEGSPSLRPPRPSACGVLRYPLLGAAGYHQLQDSSFCWAHPRAAVNVKRGNAHILFWLSSIMILR
jgi:hypothetical protein